MESKDRVQIDDSRWVLVQQSVYLLCKQLICQSWKQGVIGTSFDVSDGNRRNGHAKLMLQVQNILRFMGGLTVKYAGFGDALYMCCFANALQKLRLGEIEFQPQDILPLRWQMEKITCIPDPLIFHGVRKDFVQRGNQPYSRQTIPRASTGGKAD